MKQDIEAIFKNLHSSEDEIRYPAFQQAYALTEQKVDWVYEVWDQLFEMLASDNSYQRSIALRLFCNLARSDSEKRLIALLPQILAHTKDEKFITSRQTLQEVWKIAWFLPETSAAVEAHLKQRFLECGEEKHANLLRQDALQSLFTLAELKHDEGLMEEAKQLIESDPEEKNRKAYRAMMKGKN
jgi:hypothetical protein